MISTPTHPSSYAACAFALAVLASTPAAAQVETPEFLAQWGLKAIGAQNAVAAGITGAGIGVVVVDEPFLTTHPEFSGRIGPLQYDPEGFGPGDHGTHVAGIIGAGRNGFGMEGVAPEVLLSSIGFLDPAELSGMTREELAAAYNAATAMGLLIFNNSWGNDPATDITTVTRAQAEANISPALLNAFRSAVNAGAVIVFATGNDAMANPDIPPGLPYLFPELIPGWIAVTSVNQSLNFDTDVNACGVTAIFCIAAPGVAIYSTGAAGANFPYYTDSGTSMAAPHVTGAIALAREMFPNATNAQLTAIVLRTATDIGAPGIDSIFGWGLLSVGNLVDSIDPANGALFATAAFGRFATIDTLLSALWNRSSERRSGGSSPTGVAFAPPAGSTAMALGGPVQDAGWGTSPYAGPAGRAAWAQGVLGYARIDSGPSSPGARANTGGGIGGYDLLASDDWYAGVAIAVTQSDVETKGLPDDASAQGLHGFLYGSWARDRWFADAVIGASWFDSSYTRFNILGTANTVLAGQGLAGATSDDTYGFSSRLAAGHTVELGPHLVQPYLYGTWLHQRTDGSVERGADIFSLTINSNDLDQYEGGIGVRAEAGGLVWRSFSLSPVLDLAYGRLGGDRAFPLTVELLGTPIAAEAAEVGPDMLRVGALIGAVHHDGTMAGFIGYDGRFQENAENHSFVGGLTARF